MRRSRSALAVTLTLLGWLLAVTPAQADHHLMEVSEVFGGAGASSQRDFLELRMTSPLQNNVAPAGGVSFYEEDGDLITQLSFTQDVTNGATGDNILVATPQAEEWFGLQADLEAPSGMNIIVGAGGKACFTSTSFPSPIDCVSWGTFAGATLPAMDQGESLAKQTGTFSIASPTPRNNARVTGSPPSVGFAQENYTVAEGSDTLIQVARTEPFNTSVSVNYATSAGTAEAADYTETSGPANFDPDVIQTSFQVFTAAAGDADTDNETVNLTLSSPTNDWVLGNSTATLTIIDDDGLPTLMFDSATVSFAESGNSESIGFTRVGNPNTELGVTAVRTGGTTTAGADYLDQPFGGGLESGETTGLITMHQVDDTRDEPDETLVLMLQVDPAEGQIGSPSTTTITITDNDTDSTKPTSRVTKPAHTKSYARGSFTKLLGTATDTNGTMTGVQVALQMKMKNGSCKYYNGTTFVIRPCSSKLFRNATGTATWRLNLGSFRLPKSTGPPKIQHYVAFSRAKNLAGLTETNFATGRNNNRFEIT